MSVYGPRFELPEIQLPELGLNSKIIAMVIGAIIIIALAVLVLPGFLESLKPPITFSWNNNPLDLRENATIPAELNITLINTSKETITLNFDVDTNSTEILVLCPYKTFTNVEPNNTRNTTCIVRRNPESVIFEGTYNLTINSTLGTAKTTLEVITK